MKQIAALEDLKKQEEQTPGITNFANFCMANRDLLINPPFWIPFAYTVQHQYGFRPKDLAEHIAKVFDNAMSPFHVPFTVMKAMTETKPIKAALGANPAPPTQTTVLPTTVPPALQITVPPPNVSQPKTNNYSNKESDDDDDNPVEKQPNAASVFQQPKTSDHMVVDHTTTIAAPMEITNDYHQKPSKSIVPPPMQSPAQLRMPYPSVKFPTHPTHSVLKCQPDILSSPHHEVTEEELQFLRDQNIA